MGIIFSFLFFLSALFLFSFSGAILLLKKKQLQHFGLKSNFFSTFEKQFLNFANFENTLMQMHLAGIFFVFTAILCLVKLSFLPIFLSLCSFFILTYLTYLTVLIWPHQILTKITSFAIFHFYLLYPLTAPLSILYKKLHKKSLRKNQDKITNKLKHLILGEYDEKLFSALFTFHEKDAREVMVPRINIFALPLNTSIKKAAELTSQEDYSRIPIYRTDLDTIIGFFMYKDLLKIFMQAQKTPSLLDEPIEILLKPVIYAPENKKINFLFQDFKKKQSHLAIIVNEYGNTEGLITIEDILEELVGEIKDEYDLEEEKGFWKLPGGSYIVDAQTSIIDIEKKIGIQIPHSPEYETIGGFLFQKAGSIPQKGWSLCLDEFEIEVLISSERRLDKLRLIPLFEKKERIAKE